LDSLQPTDIDPEFIDFTGVLTIPMRGLLRWHATENDLDIPVGLEAMQSHHAKLRVDGRGHEIWDQIEGMQRRIIVVDALREPSDMATFKQILGGSVVALAAEVKTR